MRELSLFAFATKSLLLNFGTWVFVR